MGFLKQLKGVWETRLLGWGKETEAFKLYQTIKPSPHPNPPRSPPTPQNWKGVTRTEEREQGRGGGGEEEGEAGSRKFSAIPGIQTNAGGRRTQEAPLPF